MRKDEVDGGRQRVVDEDVGFSLTKMSRQIVGDDECSPRRRLGGEENVETHIALSLNKNLIIFQMRREEELMSRYLNSPDSGIHRIRDYGNLVSG